MDITINNAFIILEKYLKKNNENKFEHSCRVAKTSQILAQKWDSSLAEDAYIACLLHDIGKSLTKQQMLNVCARKRLTLYDFEIFGTPSALHNKISSIIFEEIFDSSDSNRFNAISHAISCHNTGTSTMNLLDKIVFIADNIEPNKENDFLSKIQSGKLTSPNECIKTIIDWKIEKAKKKDRELNPLLINTLESIEER